MRSPMVLKQITNVIVENAKLPRSPRTVRRRGVREIFHDKSRVTHPCVDRDFLVCSTLWSFGPFMGPTKAIVMLSGETGISSISLFC